VGRQLGGFLFSLNGDRAMSKGFAMALVAALVLVPCAAVVCAAEQQSAEAKQECCNKECSENGSDCQCTDCKCADGNTEDCACTDCKCAGGECTDGKCAAGKCSKNCEDGKCVVTKCSTEACKEAGCKCEGSKCAKGETLAICEESDCRGTAGVLTENGKWCPNGCSDCSGDHISGYCWKSDGPSVIGSSGRSQLGIPWSQPSSAAADVLWQQIASELEGDSSSESPRDRILVKLTATTEPATGRVATAYALPYQAPVEATRSNASLDGENERDTQIQYSIQIVEDREGCLAEYEDLRRGAPMMCAESKTLLPAMRALHKHELIRQLSSPKITCNAGQTAELEIASAESIERDGMRLEVSGQQMNDGLMVQLAMCSSDDQRNFEVRSAMMIEEGQTIVLNANRGSKRENNSQAEEPAVYIVVTPEVVR
jgi:hypothetical protein